jgi:hypothetical protein
VVGGEWAVRGGVRVATGLRDVLRFGDDVVPTAEAAGQAASVARISPTALIAAVVARITPTAVKAATDDPPTVRVTPPTPVSDTLFGPTPVNPTGATVLDPPAEHLSPPEHLDPPVEHPDFGPVWTGDRLPNNRPNDRPDVSAVPQEQWDIPGIVRNTRHAHEREHQGPRRAIVGWGSGAMGDL